MATVEPCQNKLRLRCSASGWGARFLAIGVGIRVAPVLVRDDARRFVGRSLLEFFFFLLLLSQLFLTLFESVVRCRQGSSLN